MDRDFYRKKMDAEKNENKKDIKEVKEELHECEKKAETLTRLARKVNLPTGFSGIFSLCPGNN